MAKLFVIVNGKSAGETSFRSAIKELRKIGHSVEIRSTWEEGDVDRYVEEALSQHKFDTIVAAGGDGTVNEIAQALVSHNAPKNTRLAIVPMGTANDLARGIGIPTDSWEAMQLAAQDTASPVDVCTVNGQVFMNVATGGSGAEITESTDPALKDSIGGAAYILTGIMNPQTISARQAVICLPLDAQVKGEGGWEPITEGENHGDLELKGDHAVLEGQLLVLAVGNGRQAGGGVQLCPDAIMDDGLLDVSYIMNPSTDTVRKLIMGLEKDCQLEGATGRFRCAWLKVDCPEGLQINRDGEPMKTEKYHFQVQPKRLMLHMPHTDLVGSRATAHKYSTRERWAQGLERFRPQGLDRTGLLQSSILRSALRHTATLGVGVLIGWKLHSRRGTR